MSRFEVTKKEKEFHIQLNYTGLEDRIWEPETFTLLMTVALLENLVFSDYEGRLKFDVKLIQNRALADQMKEKLRLEIIRKYDIKLPLSRPTIQP